MALRLDSPDFKAFQSFAESLGVAVVLTRASTPAFIHEGADGPSVLFVPDAYTPEQQGRLGADLARMVLTITRERDVA